MIAEMFGLADALRRHQGSALGALGLGPAECRYKVLASARRWRLRDYGNAGAAVSLLIVAAPIKRPYIWDLAPSASAVRYCLRRGFHVYLLEWRPPAGADRGGDLAAYAGEAVGEAVASVTRADGGARPFLVGHSLGGTLAAVFAALRPHDLRGLVLLGAPLCFAPGSSRFRDAMASLAPALLPTIDPVPGSLLSQMSALASPETFVWSRLMDGALSLGDARCTEICARVERWALDEVPVPGPLARQILSWLYREDRFYRETLSIRGRIAGPSGLRLPTLAAVNCADDVAPAKSVAPFIAAMAEREARVIEYPGETGVGLQHLAILVGRHAYAEVWPAIVSWIDARR